MEKQVKELKRERLELTFELSLLENEFFDLEKSEQTTEVRYKKEEILSNIFNKKRQINCLDVEIYNLENELTK